MLNRFLQWLRTLVSRIIGRDVTRRAEDDPTPPAGGGPGPPSGGH